MRRNLCSRLHVGGDYTANMAVATSFKPYSESAKIQFPIRLNYQSHKGVKMKTKIGLMLVVLGMLFQSLNADITTGLVAYYPFNGNANDASGNSNNGTVKGAQLTTDRNGKANSAYHFNGVSDHITLNPSATLSLGANGFTLSAWVNAEKLSDNVTWQRSTSSHCRRWCAQCAGVFLLHGT